MIFRISHLWKSYTVKIGLIFVRSTLFHIKFQWVCSLLGKNSPDFVFPNLKLHNKYCHKFCTLKCLSLSGAKAKQRPKNQSKILRKFHKYQFNGPRTHCQGSSPIFAKNEAWIIPILIACTFMQNNLINRLLRAWL